MDTMAAFPNTDHDDDVSTTQALNYMAGRGNNTGLLRAYEEEARELTEKQSNE